MARPRPTDQSLFADAGDVGRVHGSVRKAFDADLKRWKALALIGDNVPQSLIETARQLASTLDAANMRRPADPYAVSTVAREFAAAVERIAPAIRPVDPLDALLDDLSTPALRHAT